MPYGFEREHAPRFIHPDDDPIDEDLRSIREAAEHRATQIAVLVSMNGVLARLLRQSRLLLILSLIVQAVCMLTLIFDTEL